MNDQKGKNYLDVLVEKGIVDACGFKRYESLYGAYATYNIGASCQTVTATSRKDPLEAIIKVMSKAYERYCCEQYSHSATMPAKTFSDPLSHFFGQEWVDPREYVPFTKKQRRISGLEKFSDDEPICWIQGRHLHMNEDHKIIAAGNVYVPRDMVYRGKNKTFYHATSSGVAAGVSKEDAIIRATAELIERDAIIRTYLKRESPNVVPEVLLPIDVCAEKRRLENSGWTKKKIYTLCLPGYIPTALTVITNSMYPFAVFGAAASFISFRDAIRKSFDEAEYNHWDFAEHEDEGHIYLPRRAVVDPYDHGVFYAGLLSRCLNLSWLWSGEELTDIPEVCSFADAIRDLDLISVVLSKRSNLTKDIPLWVIRILSPKLIPISYGNGMIHYTHPSIDFDIFEESKSVKEPHFFNQGSVRFIKF